jgi:hypothetical protein
MQWPRVNPIPHQPTINHRRANDGGDGSSRCHSNNLDSWRGDNKRAGFLVQIAREGAGTDAADLRSFSPERRSLYSTRSRTHRRDAGDA